MYRYITAPYEVEAIQWTDDNAQEVINFLQTDFKRFELGTVVVKQPRLGISLIVPKQYWIVKHGNLYETYSDHIFKGKFIKLEDKPKDKLS